MANELQTRSAWAYGNHFFRDVSAGPTETPESIMQIVPLSILANPSNGFVFFDDFTEMVSTKAAQSGHWAVTEDDGASGTDAVQDAAGGWYKHYCDGDDNDEAYVHSNCEVFKFLASKHLWFEAQLKLTEANTDDANIIVGLSENVGADHLLDNGGGPPANYDGVCFYKVDGTMAWGFETSVAAAQVTTASLVTHVSANIFRLGFWARPTSATAFSVMPFYKNITAGTAGAFGTPHTMALGGGEMEAFFGVKAGGANEEAIEVDYIFVAQQR